MILASIAPAAAAPAPLASPPNILFLMCDSMDGRVVDPTSPVSKRVATPTLDHLAATGVNFVRTYAASPQCVPSRTTMLAGRRTDQIRAFSNGNGLAGDPSTGGLDANCVEYYDEEVCSQWAETQNVSSTFFDALSPVYAAGNAVEGDCTMCVMGKVDVGQNILSRYGPHATADGWHNGPGLQILTRAADIRKPTKPDPRAITNDDDDHVHPEDWKMHTQCIEWLQAEGAARRRRRRSLGASVLSPPPPPWFLYCSLNIPHPAFNTNATWLAAVDQPAVRASPPVWPDNVSAYHPHDAYMSVSKAVGGAFSDYEIFKTRRTYYAMVAETDFLMGQVVDAARASGMYDDTLVVFLSDHGEMNMEHRQVWKNAHYEASARVPLIVSGGARAGGALPRGRVVANLTSLLDSRVAGAECRRRACSRARLGRARLLACTARPVPAAPPCATRAAGAPPTLRQAPARRPACAAQARRLPDAPLDGPPAAAAGGRARGHFARALPRAARRGGRRRAQAVRRVAVPLEHGQHGRLHAAAGRAQVHRLRPRLQRDLRRLRPAALRRLRGPACAAGRPRGGTAHPPRPDVRREPLARRGAAPPSRGAAQPRRGLRAALAPPLHPGDGGAGLALPAQADPDELQDLAAAQPQLAATQAKVAALDATLRAELASGDNALSRAGDYREIDVYVKAQQQRLYRRFFADGGPRLARQFGRLLACEADRASQSVAEFARADPELERPCAAALGSAAPSGAAALAELRRAAEAEPSQQLRKLFEKAYTGFDDADWAKVQAWAKADPGA